MSASFALPEQIDGLEKLITLASLNKEDIIATQTEARKQLQLTQEEQGKVAAARAYIAKHAALSADLQRREDELAQKNKDLIEEKRKHADFVASENIRLETFAAELIKKDAEHAAAAQRIANQDGELKAAIAEHAKQNNEIVNSNAAIARATAADKLTNEKEAERLKEWELTLKGKAQRLREQAANF